MGIYRPFSASVIRILAEIGVMRFNDTEGQDLYSVLTVGREFPEEIGKRLAELVLERVTLPEIPERQLLLPTQLVRRESSSAPSSSRAGHSMKSGDESRGPATGASAGTSESDDGLLRY
jgi:LacI family transcriptional regulator